jgi:protein-S-isoprenylcysteine O-methyltransferase
VIGIALAVSIHREINAKGAPRQYIEVNQHYTARDLKKTAFFSFGLASGVILSASFTVARAFGATAFWIYFAYLCVFHYFEFMLTAFYHPDTISSESFLLNHSTAYHIAAIASWAEFWIEFIFFPQAKSSLVVSLVGMGICSIGQFIRTGAMFQAGHNFTHLVATTKKNKHRLVTNGLYAISRHPSYAGWFWWSIGTQLILSNPICVCLYALASWNFFNSRIP